ncbi:MAG TPA: DUF6782 family putative metallopeptidase [Alphaproteobacteria bacterium]
MKTASRPAKQLTKNRPRVRWDRGNLLEWLADLPKARRHEDHDRLSALFGHAAEIPVLKSALKWAESHNICFIVDHTTLAGGYYTPDTGVVAIALDCLYDRRYVLGALVHEIRHAWQDYYGFIPAGGKSFTDYYMRIALIEADATAHQNLAEWQFDIAENIRAQKRLINEWDTLCAQRGLTSLQAKMENTIYDRTKLWRDFKAWYRHTAKDYGENAQKLFGHALGIPGVQPVDYKFEYEPHPNNKEPQQEGINIARFEDIQKLSRSFNGHHYFNAASYDFLQRIALSPDRASVFYERTCLKNYELEEIRRRHLLLKHHKGHDILI